MKKLVIAGILTAAVAVGAYSMTASADAPKEPAAAKAEKKSEALLVQVQGICPVSGIELGGHGEPLKTKIEGRTLFLCCAGCEGEKADLEHMAAIDARLAAAQGICPVMEEPLPKEPKSLVVEGRMVFVCCPPCSKKITAEPAKYLKIVDAQYAKHLAEKKKSEKKDAT